MTDRMPIGRSRPPSATVHDDPGGSSRSRMSAIAASTAVASGIADHGRRHEVPGAQAAPVNWRFGWTNVALTRSVREISPTA